MARLQDIHLEDKEDWLNFRSKWNESNYAEAIDILSKTSLKGKYINANMFNVLTEELVRLQNLSLPTSDKKILIQNNQPTSQEAGELWFQTESLR